jgi:hypothetical protein
MSRRGPCRHVRQHRQRREAPASKVYARHGTTTETRLMVIDRVLADGPTAFTASLGMVSDARVLLDWVTAVVSPRPAVTAVPSVAPTIPPVARQIRQAQRIPPSRSPIRLEQGIIFTTYATLRSDGCEEKLSRVQQIVDWLGNEFDGVMVFDQSHAMQNAAGEKSERGDHSPLLQGKAGLRLQHALPNARVLYARAQSVWPCPPGLARLPAHRTRRTVPHEGRSSSLPRRSLLRSSSLHRDCRPRGPVMDVGAALIMHWPRNSGARAVRRILKTNRDKTTRLSIASRIFGDPILLPPVFGTAGSYDTQLGRRPVQHLADALADTMQGPVTARACVAGGIRNHIFMRRCSGSGLRLAWASALNSTAASISPSRDSAAAKSVLRSSSASSNWSASMRSDRRPNCARCSLPMISRRRSISPSRCSTTAAMSRIKRCKTAISDGRLSRSNRMRGCSAARAVRTSHGFGIAVMRTHQPAIAGRHTRSGVRQSMPSISIASCASVSAMVPPGSLILGQTKPP